MKRGRRMVPAACAALAILIGTAQATEAPATGDEVMVVSAHPDATRIGVSVLAAGGNAVDAAVAVACALAVCEPYSSGLGGGGFFVTFEATTGRVAALDARETAPADARSDMYVVDGAACPEMSRYGPAAVAVPGLVRGLVELHRRGGRLPWRDLLMPAADLARDGILVVPMLRERIIHKQDGFDGEARRVFLPGGRVPDLGDTLRQPDLARTLAAVAAGGDAAFYTGDVASAIAAAARTAGRGMTTSDLDAYRPRWREPVRGRYRGLEVCSMPPPSSGGVHLIQMLNILSGYDLTAAGYGSAAAWHPMAEAMKHAYADRSRWLGDPDFWDVPVAWLTSMAYADTLRTRIRPDCVLQAAGTPPGDNADSESPETTHFGIVDGEGNAVAATLTINLTFGSGVVAVGTGVLLNDEMDDFVAVPGVPNAFGLVGGKANSIAPGKRPLSSMTPTIVLRDGRVCLVTGSPGGSRIITTTLQTVVHVVDFGMDPLQAVSAPRIHHQWQPPRLSHEAFGISPDTATRLSALGHDLHLHSPMGNAQLIVIEPDTGVRLGASDPRGMGLAAGF